MPIQIVVPTRARGYYRANVFSKEGAMQQVLNDLERCYSRLGELDIAAAAAPVREAIAQLRQSLSDCQTQVAEPPVTPLHQGQFAKIARHCRERGADLPAEVFQDVCQLLNKGLERPLDDLGLAEHFSFLIERGDRLAAVLLIVPMTWSYSIVRDFSGQATAKVSPPFGGQDYALISDDEASAVLGALALALDGSGSTRH